MAQDNSTEEKPPFATLVQQFNDCPCGATAYVKAMDMLHFYPNETMAMFPKIPFSQLNLDGDPSKGPNISEAAAVMASAKYIHERSTTNDRNNRIPDIAMADVTMNDVLAPIGPNNAQNLYDRMKRGDFSCGL